MNFRIILKKAGIILLVTALVLTTLSSCNRDKNGGSSTMASENNDISKQSLSEITNGSSSAENGSSDTETQTSTGTSQARSTQNKGNGSSNKPSGDENWQYNLVPVKAEDLEETGDKQNRYLTIPNSRLVLNPYAFESLPREVTQFQYSNSPRMPVNIGYCDPHFNEGRGIELSKVGLFAEGTSSAGTKPQLLWKADLGNASAWTASGVKGKDYQVNFSKEKIDLSVLSTAEVAWQHVESKASVDLTNAYLTVTVNSVQGGNIAIKVTRGSGVDTTLIETSTAGTYTFNLKEATGWTGRTNIGVKIFSVAKGSKVSFSNLKIESAKKIYSDASSNATTWRPDRLGFEASYPDGMKLTGNDFFYDEKTVVRNFKAENGKALLVYGEFNGNVSLDGNTILVKRNTFKYAINLSENIKPQFYSSMVDVLSGAAGSNTPSASAYGIWAYKIASPEAKNISLAFSFDDKAVEDSKVIGYVRAVKGDVAADLANRTKTWNNLLAKVPNPSNFQLTGIDTMGMTAEMVKHSYYVAWVQVIGNLLPKNPENNYNYPSFATGKGSLWAYGSPKCSYSAIWEALYNTQLYAQIDPDVAWDMFIGFHSLVDDEGIIAGESLPPNNARVAWSLHTVKPNLDALKIVQPQLDRHLKWRFENPRWIYGNHTPDKSQKDIDFVASALIDIRYLMKINNEIGLGDQNADWERRITTLHNSMKLWFFSDALDVPNQYYSASTGGRSEGNQLWSFKALHVPGIEAKETNRLLQAYDKRFNETKAFAGMGGVKYEPYIYTVLGLFQHGRPNGGRKLLAVGIRDITRAGIHAEGYNYDHNEQNPLPEGVRPSLFGAAMMIEMVLVYNGLRFDDGMPVLANYVSGNGGVENWSLYNGTFNFSKSGNRYTYGGSSVGENKTVDVAENEVKLVFEGTNVHPLH